MQLTSFSAGFTNAPRWSPDGKRIVFASVQNSNRDIYIVSPDGGSLRRLTTAPSGGRQTELVAGWPLDLFLFDRTGRTEIWKMPAEGGEMVQVTTGGGHESFESPDGKLLYYEDYGVKGLQSHSHRSILSPKEGPVVLPSVRPGYWAVAEKGIYFVEFDDRRCGSRYRLGKVGFPLRTVSHPIKFYDFRTRKVTQIGTIEKEVCRTAGGFSVTWDGRTSPGPRSTAPNPI